MVRCGVQVLILKEMRDALEKKPDEDGKDGKDSGGAGAGGGAEDKDGGDRDRDHRSVGSACSRLPGRFRACMCH